MTVSSCSLKKLDVPGSLLQFPKLNLHLFPIKVKFLLKDLLLCALNLPNKGESHLVCPAWSLVESRIAPAYLFQRSPEPSPQPKVPTSTPLWPTGLLVSHEGIILEFPLCALSA